MNNAKRAADMGCSPALVNGIRRYDERIASLGGYGAPVTVSRPNGETITGQLIERGFGGCQPGIRTADGQEYAILLDPVSWGSDWPVLVQSRA